MKTKKKFNVIFACGGTLGHINPTFPVAKSLSNIGYNIYYFFTTKEVKREFLKKYSFIKKIYYFKVMGYNRKKLWKNFEVIINNNKTQKEIRAVLKEIDPDIIVGMGGSISALTIIQGYKMKYKVVIHEQNALIGLGNKMVLKKVDKILLSYPIKGLINKLKVVGNPVEEQYYKLRKENEITNSILIFGGSNGAEKINDFFINNSLLFNKYHIIIFTGNKYYSNNKTKINKVKNETFEIYDSTNDMIKYYHNAKVVICRGGATTLAEIIGLEKLCIVIPSPNVTNNHQYYNAKYYYDLNCIEMLEEKDLNFLNIKNKIDNLFNENISLNMRQNIIKNHNIYSSELFVKEIFKTIGERD